MKPNIRITHFVNPHLFYYKLDELNADLGELEKKIFNELIKQRDAKNFQPAKGDVVAFLHKKWSKWIRVVVEDILNFTTADDKYILWAIDYGVPFESTIKSIHQLPKHLKDVHINNAINCGSIINCVPATNEYNFMTNQVECLEIDKWSELAVNTISGLIKASKSIRFDQRNAAPFDDRCFGELTFHLENGDVKAVETLIEIKQGLRKTEMEFFRDVQKLQTLNQCPWKNSKGSAIVFNQKNRPAPHSKAPSNRVGKSMQKPQECDDESWDMCDANNKTTSASNKKCVVENVQKQQSCDKVLSDMPHANIQTTSSSHQKRIEDNVQKPQATNEESWDMPSTRIKTHGIDDIDQAVIDKVHKWYIKNEPHALKQIFSDEDEQQPTTSAKFNGNGNRRTLPAPSEIGGECQPQLRQGGLRSQNLKNKQPRQPHTRVDGGNKNNSSTDTLSENNEERWDLTPPDTEQHHFFERKQNKKLPAPSEIGSRCQPQMKQAGLVHRRIKKTIEPPRLPHSPAAKSTDGHSLYSHREDHENEGHSSFSDKFETPAQNRSRYQENQTANTSQHASYIPSGYESAIPQFKIDNRENPSRINRPLLEKSTEKPTVGRGKKFFG